MKKNHDMAILIVSCDAYADVAEVFFPLFEKHWPECNYPVYFVNNSLTKNYGDAQVINAGETLDWSGRVKLALQQVKEKYVLFMLEDYYIGKPVDSTLISQALDCMRSENIFYYRITNQPRGKSIYKNYSHLSPIPNNQPYGINLQAAIWEKDFFKESLGENDCSAWEVEINHLKKVENKFTENLQNCVVDTRNIIDIHNGVIKGKWVPRTISHFRRNGFMIEMGNRKKLSFKDQLSIAARSFFGSILSNNTRRFLKRSLLKLGFRFTSDQ